MVKIVKDWFLKLILGSMSTTPRGLAELYNYFRLFNVIEFEYKQEKDGIVAVSNNYKYGTIITSAKNYKELDKNIKDAILTAFDLPSSYAKEAKIVKQGSGEMRYALA